MVHSRAYYGLVSYCRFFKHRMGRGVDLPLNKRTMDQLLVLFGLVYHVGWGEHSPTAGLMLCHCLRRWPSIKPALDVRLVLVHTLSWWGSSGGGGRSCI